MRRSFTSCCGAAVPVALLAASLLRPNLISLSFLLAFGGLQFRQTLPGLHRRPAPHVWSTIACLAACVLCLEALVAACYVLKGRAWPSGQLTNELIKLLGFSDYDIRQEAGVQEAVSSSLPQIAVLITAACAAHTDQQSASWRARRVSTGPIPPQRRYARSIVLPVALVLAGSVRPSCASLVYFLTSCMGLWRWATANSYDGLAWAWRLLMVYSGNHFLLLYCYQLSGVTYGDFQEIVEGGGLFKLTYWQADQWPEYLQALSLVILYWVLCIGISDVEAAKRSQWGTWPSPLDGSTADVAPLQQTESLTTSLLQGQLEDQLESDAEPTRVRQWRAASSWRWVSVFHTYGFLLCLVALVTWTFIDLSCAAFILLLYVAYVFFSFPSSEKLQKLNPLLLLYILAWDMATYLFNLVPADHVDPSWSVIGLWRWQRAGPQVLAQFLLAALWALDVFARNVVLEQEHVLRCQPSANGTYEPDEPASSTRPIYAIALISWCIRKSAHVGSLVVLFFVGISALDLLHAVYLMFFLMYLLVPRVARWASIYLITYCELHFAVLYLFRLAWFQGLRKEEWRYILDTIGLWRLSVLKDFAGVALLLGFSAVQYHGAKSLKQLEGENFRDRVESHWTTARLATLIRTITRAYRHFGLYIAYCTVVLVIYAVPPSVVGLGYLVWLLVWVLANHRWQPMRHSRAWAPLLLFCVLVGMLRYVVGAFPTALKVLQDHFGLSEQVLRELGLVPLKKGQPLLEHLWDSTVLLCTLQMYRYQQTRRGDYLPLERELEEGDHIDPNSGAVGFLKRLIILHANKALTLAAFFAAVRPVSPLGLVYLLLVVFLSNAPKASLAPARTYLVYTALYVTLEYLNQVAGPHWGSAPGDAHGPFTRWLGLQQYGKGPRGTEAALRGKMAVLGAALLQLVASSLLSTIPASLVGDPLDLEPCLLFMPYPRRARPTHPSDNASAHAAPPPSNPTQNGGSTAQKEPRSPSTPPATLSGPGAASSRQSPLTWSRSPSGHWARRAHQFLRQERYYAQLRTLKVYGRHLVENFFVRHGLEICMLALLVAAFTLLNIFSLVYIAILGVCVLASRPFLQKVWPGLVFLFATVLVAEYVVASGYPPPWRAVPTWHTQYHGLESRAHSHSPAPAPLPQPHRCHNCWRLAATDKSYCWCCWLGTAVDDPNMLWAYLVVFWLALLQQRATNFRSSEAARHSQPALLPSVMAPAWREIAYEAHEQWTWLDHLRFLFYKHLLLVVLVLVFATGSLKYDLLHLGYLAFSLVFFRMRSAIMHGRNTTFHWLRLYNYVLIVASLIYQAPWFEYEKEGSCSNLFSLVGLYKYRYGADLQRGAIVDITIFCAVALQSKVLRTPEFAQMVRFLKAAELEARAQAHEAAAAWKKRELERMRRSVDAKRLRRAQVLRLKKDILHLQLRLDLLNSTVSASMQLELDEPPRPMPEQSSHKKRERVAATDYPYSTEPAVPIQRPISPPTASPEGMHSVSAPEIRREEQTERRDNRVHTPLSASSQAPTPQGGRSATRSRNPRVLRALSVPTRSTAMFQSEQGSTSTPRRLSIDNGGRLGGVLEGVTMFGDQAMAQVQSLGGRALANLVDYLHLEEDASAEGGGSSDEVDAAPVSSVPPQPSPKPAPRPTEQWSEASPVSEQSWRTPMVNDSMQSLSIIMSYIARMLRANTDKVCYTLFVVVFIWNFSFLTLLFPLALFTYALLVNPVPSPHFWLATLIYTEANILLQYTYQIPSVSYCHVIDPGGQLAQWLAVAGIRAYPGSFVAGVLPLFLVYLATLVHTSMKAQNGEWTLLHGDNRRHQHRGGDSEARGVHHRLLAWFFQAFQRMRCYIIGIVRGAEAPPHFVLVSMAVPLSAWQEGIQPGRIEEGINSLLAAAHLDEGPANKGSTRVRVESVEQSADREDVALAVVEVLYSEDMQETLTPAGDAAARLTRVAEEGRAAELGFPYPIESVVAGGRREVDLYAYIFGTDLLTFFFVAIFYNSAVGNKNLFFAAYDQDQFPKEYVWVLVTLFVLMVADRVLYLCSSAALKVVYYVATLLLYTGYTMRLFWTTRLHSSQATFQLFFLLKALSFALEATQIKYGAPKDSALCTQFLMRQIDHLHWVGFTVYRALPFVYELRTVLDWSCATTSLVLYDWLKLEDIYASLFLVQCDIKLNRQRHRLGQKQEAGYKFCSGVVLFALLCTVIWAPMLMYSTGNPTNLANPVQDLRVTLQLDTPQGLFPLYEAGARRHIHNLYKPPQVDVLRPYDPLEIQLFCCYSDADTVWQVPPPTQKVLPALLDPSSVLRVTWRLSRARPVDNAVVVWESLYNRTGVDVAEQLRAVMNGSQESAAFPNLYPKFFRVPGLGDPRVLEGTGQEFVSGNLTLHHGAVPWWSFHSLNMTGENDCTQEGGPMLVVVSEEVPGGILGKTLSKFGITGLYITFVLGVGRFFRLWVSDLRMRIPYENLPACDRLVAICEDIYAARTEGELELEEGLFWTLIKIYRSPHILLEYTKADKVD